MAKQPTITGNLEGLVYYDWTETKLSAARIANSYPGLTKNMVVGHAWRRRWPPRAPLKMIPKLEDRLAAYNYQFEAILATCSG